jgi:4-hydroxy-tetrahydrodipicolinate synthase
MFEGLSVAMVTPFCDGHVDETAVQRLVDFLVVSGVDCLVIAGSTGEGATLTRGERIRLYQLVRETAAARCQLVAGTGTNDTAVSIELTKEAEAAGMDGAMLVVPFYNKPTPDGQVAHFTAIADATGLPVILYNVPGRTGSNMLPETVARLAPHPRIVAVKEASGSLDQVSELRRDTDLTILSGDDSLTLPILSVGGRGVISVVGNVAPREMREMLIHFEAGRNNEAAAMHARLMPLMKGLFIESNPGPVKYLLASWSLIANELRLPLVPVSAASEDRIRQAAEAAEVRGPQVGSGTTA